MHTLIVFSPLVLFVPWQIAYLQNLGCTIVPTSRLHASRLIEEYKSLWYTICLADKSRDNGVMPILYLTLINVVESGKSYACLSLPLVCSNDQCLICECKQYAPSISSNELCFPLWEISSKEFCFLKMKYLTIFLYLTIFFSYNFARTSIIFINLQVYVLKNIKLALNC